MIYAILVIGILNLVYLISIQLQVRQTAKDLGLVHTNAASWVRGLHKRIDRLDHDD